MSAAGPSRGARAARPEGLVTVRPRRGAVVRSLSREFLQAYQVREALETVAVRLAVPRSRTTTSPRSKERIDEITCMPSDDRRRRVLRGQRGLPRALFKAVGQRALSDMYRQLLGHMGRYRMRSLALRGTSSGRRGARAILRACPRGDPEPAEHLVPTTSACRSAGSRRPERRGAVVLGDDACEFGVNLNNREPLIAPDYDLPMLLDLAERVEAPASTPCGSATASSRSRATSRSPCSRRSPSARRG